MAYESLLTLERSVVFRETFANSFAVQSNRYAKGTLNSTGISFQNGILKSNLGYITYKKSINLVGSVRFIGVRTSPSFNNFYFYFGTGTGYLLNTQSSPGYLQSNSGNIYVNGFLIGASNQSSYVLPINQTIDVIVSGITLKGFLFLIGAKTSGVNILNGFNFELFEIYNRTLSTSEITLLYQQQLYSQPLKLPLLLDFDSTRGILEDRTGLNTLTSVGTSTIQKIGNIYSYSPSWNARIETGKNYFANNSSIIISLWGRGYQWKSQGYGSAVCPSSLRLQLGLSNGQYSNSPAWVTDSNYINNSSGNISFSKLGFVNIIYVLNTNKSFSCYFNGNLYTIITSVVNRGNITGFNIGFHPTGSYNYSGAIKYITKVQVFNGISSNPNLFAAQLFSSQKNQFGL